MSNPIPQKQSTFEKPQFNKDTQQQLVGFKSYKEKIELPYTLPVAPQEISIKQCPLRNRS